MEFTKEQMEQTVEKYKGKIEKKAIKDMITAFLLLILFLMILFLPIYNMGPTMDDISKKYDYNLTSTQKSQIFTLFEEQDKAYQELIKEIGDKDVEELFKNSRNDAFSSLAIDFWLKVSGIIGENITGNAQKDLIRAYRGETDCYNIIQVALHDWEKEIEDEAVTESAEIFITWSKFLIVVFCMLCLSSIVGIIEAATYFMKKRKIKFVKKSFLQSDMAKKYYNPEKRTNIFLSLFFAFIMLFFVGIIITSPYMFLESRYYVQNIELGQSYKSSFVRCNWLIGFLIAYIIIFIITMIPTIKENNQLSYELAKEKDILLEENKNISKQINVSENDFSVTSTKNEGSVIDQLKQYKKLLDDGVITQEDFDTKKKQLLK